MRTLMIWYSIVSCLLIIAGLIFSFFGFTVFPSIILPEKVLLPWESAIYGSVLIGWGATLFFLGRFAFRRKGIELMKLLILGIAIWLITEALFSAYYVVFFNVGVDVAVLIILCLPLIKSIRKIKAAMK